MLSSMLEGSGQKLVADICKASRAIVFVSVPWSGPERSARRLFDEAALTLEQTHPQCHIQFFRLEVDEDAVSQEWLSSLGFSDFATMGAGSILWLEAGRVVSGVVTANSLGVAGIVQRSTSHWGA